MKLRYFLAVTSAFTVTAAGVLAACGGDSATTPDTTDSGSTTTGTEDSGSTTTEEDSGGGGEQDAGADTGNCDKSADITATIPDAAIPDSSTTTGLCAQCAKAKCDMELKTCAQDCACQEAAGAALDCVSKLTSILDIQKCAAPFADKPVDTQDRGQKLGICVVSSCKAECAPNLPDGGF